MNNVFTFGCRLNFWESEKINFFLNENKKSNKVFNFCVPFRDKAKKPISVFPQVIVNLHSEAVSCT